VSPGEREVGASLVTPAPARSGPASEALLRGLRAALEGARATRGLHLLESR
jgi:hypothetical protein